MFDFIIRMAFHQMAATVVGNSLSGQPLFSGFFSNPPPRYKIVNQEATDQDREEFMRWAFPKLIKELEKDKESEKLFEQFNDAEKNQVIVDFWNEEHGYLHKLSDTNNIKYNFSVMWEIYQKIRINKMLLEMN